MKFRDWGVVEAAGIADTLSRPFEAAALACVVVGRVIAKTYRGRGKVGGQHLRDRPQMTEPSLTVKTYRKRL